MYTRDVSLLLYAQWFVQRACMHICLMYTAFVLFSVHEHIRLACFTLAKHLT